MDWDLPKPKTTGVAVGDDISNMSVAELDERIATLKAEIVRTEAAKAEKQRHNAAADAFFTKKA